MATVAIVAIAYFAAVIVALHFLRPDLNPISRPTSEYAVGPYGSLMASAFLSMSLASWALVISLYQGLSQAARPRIGLALLGLWAVAVLIAMIFPVDPEGAPQTLAGTIHAINGRVAFPSLTLATVLISRRFKHDKGWRALYRPATILSLLILVAFFGVPVALIIGLDFAGLAQRIYLVTFVTWFLLIATRLRSLANWVA
jgi:hypothetical protein